MQLEHALIGRSRWPGEFAFTVCFPSTPLAFLHAPLCPQVLPQSVRHVFRYTPYILIAVQE